MKNEKMRTLRDNCIYARMASISIEKYGIQHVFMSCGLQAKKNTFQPVIRINCSFKCYISFFLCNFANLFLSFDDEKETSQQSC
jgi:hypothetical protein